MRSIVFLFLLIVSAELWPASAQADTFGTGPLAFDIEFVTIGDPGNPADTRPGVAPGAGAVDYSYRIGKYEISRGIIEKTNLQSDEFSNDPLTLENMTLYGGNDSGKPATGISWIEAARFVNYLNTSTGHQPAYRFGRDGFLALWQPGMDGYDPANLFRNTLAKYFLPSFDEWHKAAYYDPTTGVYHLYPTGSDTPPTPVASGTGVSEAVFSQSFYAGPALVDQAGGASPFGAVGQGGNVIELLETALDHVNNVAGESRSVRGGAWRSTNSALQAMSEGSASVGLGSEFGGFRVAGRIPEPNSLTIIMAGVLAPLLRRP